MIGSKYFVARSIQKNKFRQKVAYLFYVERARPLKQVKRTTVASFNNSAPSHLQFDNLNNRYHNMIRLKCRNMLHNLPPETNS